MAKKVSTTEKKAKRSKGQVLDVVAPQTNQATCPIDLPKGDRVVAMIHFNTPEITEAAVQSIRKHGGEKYEIVIFDNSSDSTTTLGTNKARPFTAKLPDVTVIDNTKGQVIDFDKFLAEYPDREPYWAMLSNFGSAKHIRTVQELWRLIPQGFVLLEGDAILTKPIDWMWREDFAVVGRVQWHTNNPIDIPRYYPFLLYMNVPKLVAKGVSFFDPKRCWALQKGEMTRGNWYDTGASLLEDVINGKPELVGWNVKELESYYLHYHGGSWKNSDISNQLKWLKQNERHWRMSDVPTQQPTSKDVALCAIVRCENKYLREWVGHHLALGVKKIIICDNSYDGEEQPVEVLSDFILNGQVEVLDFRNQGGDYNVQDVAYNYVYRRYGSTFGWIGFLDIDEMVDGCDDLPKLLNGKDADVVVLSWRMMTDSGLVHYEPNPVMDRFTVPAKQPRYQDGKEFVKCFVRGGISGLTFETQPHCPTQPKGLHVVNAKGEQVEQSAAIFPSYDVAWVNHYHTKTAEEFLEKVRRGFPNDNQYTEDYAKKAEEYFFALNKRTKEKEAIINQLKA